MLLKCLTVLLLATLPGSRMQANGPEFGERIYVAYYRINWGDLPAWLEIHQNISVPILEALTAEGLIQGFDARMHSTGGDNNIRIAITGQRNTDFDSFWEQYYRRFAEADSAALERSMRMILAREHEMWNLDVLKSEVGDSVPYLHAAYFQVNVSDLAEWNRMWKDTLLPAFDGAVRENLMAGYAMLGHRGDRRYNWTFLSYIHDWDEIDDLQRLVLSVAPIGRHPLWRMFDGHKDEIWVTLPPSGS